MVLLKSKSEIERIRASCRIAADAMACVRDALAPGVTTAVLDEIAADYIRSQGAVASAKGYRGYPGSICISINEEVVHGIPGPRQLRAGDILSVDIADVDVGENIGAKLQAEQAESNKLVAQAQAEVRRAAAVATEQEMKARVHEMRARVVEAEAEVPLAMAEAFRGGNMGIMDYMRVKNVEADTGMRTSIGGAGTATGGEPKA